MMSPNTLRLLHQLLCSQQIQAGAPVEEIHAVLAARAELEAALAEVDKAPT